MSPAPLGTDVTVTAVLTITFSEVVYAPISWECLGEVRLQAGGEFVPGQWTYADRYDDDWAWGARFTPTNDLAEKTWHYGMVSQVKDSHGQRMTAPYSWPFLTGDYTPPKVVETTPPHDPQGSNPVSPEIVLTAEFDELLDEDRLDEVEFTLEGPAGLVSGTVALVEEAETQQSTLRFTPDEVLEKEARFTATVVGAVDLSGNVMEEEHAWVFHTGAGGGGGIHSGTAERVRKYYAFGGRPVALREQLRGVEAVFWLHPDHLGSTSLVTDEGGDKEAERRYFPWGEVRYEDSGEVHTGRLYTGQIRDATTDLYYYNARYYDAWLARFVSADTVVPEAGEPQSLNRYSYVLNNALRYIDPSGHCPCPDCCTQHDNEGNFDPADYWDDGVEKIPPEYRQAAEQAFFLLLCDPLHFADLYLDPEAWEASDEVVVLQIFAEYSVFHTTVEDLLSRVVSGYYGDQAGLALEDARNNYLQDWAPGDSSAPSPPTAMAVFAGIGPLVSPFGYPDLTVAPGPGWTWESDSNSPQGTDGAWVHRASGQNLHPHPVSPRHGPHIDWMSPWGRGYRIWPDGSMTPKKW